MAVYIKTFFFHNLFDFQLNQHVTYNIQLSSVLCHYIKTFFFHNLFDFQLNQHVTYNIQLSSVLFHLVMCIMNFCLLCSNTIFHTAWGRAAILFGPSVGST